MATVHHPNVPDHTREVDDADVDSWVEQGWLKSAPKKSTTAKASAEGTTSKEK